MTAPKTPSVVLDWGDSRHWSAKSRPCEYCPGLTHLLDDEGRPAHKTCAEAAAAAAAVAVVDAYRQEGAWAR
ncbi:hypothetical protein OG896_24955 [Streptomyces sp. NBC_00669]|uniref:hypothetical protein n=1 Tax=Streptomyces sp. NBC_00669 TaxID=2976011 RepID=UPI002E3769D4|nr:hypothetical protein [Streptomyces sp. NBC_00669]